MVTESNPPETLADSETEVPVEGFGSTDGSVAAAEVHTPSVHDALLETVSVDALEAGTGQHDSDETASQPAIETSETVESADSAEPAPIMQPPEALEAAPDTVTVPDVTPEAVPAIETVPASAALAVSATPEAILRPTAASFNVIGEITEVNATILAFLRSEGSAAMAHWQSLSGAKTPADVIRIQVDEMQRAADASLTCFNVLARRAGRLAQGMGRA